MAFPDSIIFVYYQFVLLKPKCIVPCNWSETVNNVYRRGFVRKFVLLRRIHTIKTQKGNAKHFSVRYSTRQIFNSYTQVGERGGSVVECRTPEREVRGSRPTAAVLCPWARHFTPRKYWLITQEAMAPSRYDWKIVDWDVKPQHNQPYTQAWSKAWSY